ncbi:hypothetical protein [Methylobacterium sp.]|uniref:hypothetical protein n=1 Tax=Methylobacterium sp. TaxID=409 RepID=UPI00183A969E|nr:hypothetical protein [Methylobacterium sp.]
MAVRFSAMEHYRSTLGTTAVAVFGLVAAAHILHPGNYEVQTRPARPVVTAAAPVAPAAWVNPPAHASAPETTGALAAGPTPQIAAAVPSTAMPTAPLPAEMARPAEPLRKAVATHRPKGAERGSRRAARLRHAALERTAQSDRPAVVAAAPQTAPVAAPSPKIDPIGDIIRGLGLGRDG